MKRFKPSNWWSRQWTKVGGLLTVSLGVVIAVGAWWTSVPERRFGWMRNDEAHCRGCGMFLRMALQDHARKNDGWHLRGNPGWPDSLTNLLAHGIQLRHLSSHGFGGRMYEHHERTGSLSADHLCYHYNEGLRIDDSEELILMYYHRPTVWTANFSKGDVLGRNVLGPTTWNWDFVPEAEFQRRQKATLDLLHERKVRADHSAFIRSNLVIVVSQKPTGTNVVRYTASLENRSDQAISFHALEPGTFTVYSGPGGFSSHVQDMWSTTKTIPAHGSHELPGEINVKVKDRPKAGGGFHRQISYSSGKQRGSSSGDYAAETIPDQVKKDHVLQVTLRVTVETELLKPLTLMLRSRRIPIVP